MPDAALLAGPYRRGQRTRRRLFAGNDITERRGPMATMTAAHLVAAAKKRIENLTPEEVAAELEQGDTVLIDLREPAERAEQGIIRGAVSAPRGMLEFYADPTSAYHRAEFAPSRRTILYCASGGRSALAAETLQCLGYTRVAHLNGGLKAWREAGLDVGPGA
jgi:rhodanese-related sulfurtransferase